MPFGIQPIHLIIVAIVALIIFGPSRLPELGRSLGKSITEFRKGMKEMTEGMREELQNPDQNQASTPTQSMPTSQPYTPYQPVQPPTQSQPVQTIQTPMAGVQNYTPAPASPGITCAICGMTNVPGARFCNQCGASLVTS
jgi:sec-independent protein translocase protein TatA